MPTPQQIFRVRRNYNKWVANQTLEDYALRFTAKRFRSWSAGKVAMTALGASAFLALEAIGGAITLSYGFTNALWAILIVSAIIFITGCPISYYASRYGVDIDLLTRGAGFGYLGSTLTSLIYASFTFIFFAIEAAILASALEALFAIPLYIGYILSAVVVIPIVTHGITFISRFQILSQPIWLGLQLLAIFIIIYYELRAVEDWTQFQGAYASQLGTGEIVHQGFNVLLFGAASSVLFALMAQIGEQVDYLRFLPPRETMPRHKWWLSVLLAGPGWIVIGVIKLLIGSFLAYLAFSDGLSIERSADPIYMYQMTFNYLVQSPAFSLILAGIMVIVCQLKINVTNAYAGSLAWSNFFSRVTHNHPGRVVWLIFNVVIALLLMELGVYRALESILGIFAIIAVSWLGTIAADLTINKGLKLAPPGIEFKRAHLFDVNPVGIGSLLGASVIGLVSYLGLFGETAGALAHFITLLSTFILAPLIAWLTKGRYYIARNSDQIISDAVDDYQCCICEHHYEPEDMSHCPFYEGNICSLCCSLDSRCMDACKKQSRLAEQLVALFDLFLPKNMARGVDAKLINFLGILLVIGLLNAVLLALVYYQIPSTNPETLRIVADALWIVFFILLIIAGVLAWIFLLANESRRVAQEESQRQTKRLLQEVAAHTQTDRALQQAIDRAEAANNAKSRYLSGISHELRTPLQTILGYAQLLAQDESIPEKPRASINIIQRSGDYLADLIEGLLDISKIEAGKLEIRRNEMDLHDFMAQLELMFRPQAEAKGIDFMVSRPNHYPHYVMADEKRLRQILINLLANAIKFTHKGKVRLSLAYRNQVATFTIKDTGIGMNEADLEKIFRPFERITHSSDNDPPGTGLGLAIVHLLTEIMGGDIKVSSTPDTGSRFTVSLFLSRVETPTLIQPANASVIGYEGSPKTVLVVDDQASHRRLIQDLLTPLGFTVVAAADAQSGLRLINEQPTDIVLLDVSLPDISGLKLAEILRQQGYRQGIIMISAEAQEQHSAGDPRTSYNFYMVKPINVQALLDKLAILLPVQWRYKNRPLPAGAPKQEPPWEVPDHPGIDQLSAYADIGYAKGFHEQLAKVDAENILPVALTQHLCQLARQARFDKISQLLDTRCDNKANK